MAAFALVFAAGCSHDTDDSDYTAASDEGVTAGDTASDETGGATEEGSGDNEDATAGEGGGDATEGGSSDGDSGGAGDAETAGDGTSGNGDSSGDAGATEGGSGDGNEGAGDGEGTSGAGATEGSAGEEEEEEPSLIAITVDDVQSVFTAISTIRGTTESANTWNFRLSTLEQEGDAYVFSVTWSAALSDPSINTTFSNLTSQDVSTDLLTAKLTDITDWDTKPTVGTQESGRIVVCIELASDTSGYYIPEELQSVTIIFTPNTDLNRIWVE